MGVPAFYRWLTDKYPLVIVDVIEEEPQEINLKRVEYFIQAVAIYEDKIFQKRARLQQAQENADGLKVKMKNLDLSNSHQLQSDKVLKYTEGLCWVMRYYYQGVCSWQCDGMNGFLCPCEWDACLSIWNSPMKGMEDITDNKVLPPVPGAISGPHLGEAAHRLLINSLSLRSNNSISTQYAQQSIQQTTRDLGGIGMSSPYQSTHHSMGSKPRPAGPPGYEQGFVSYGSKPKPAGPPGYEQGFPPYGSHISLGVTYSNIQNNDQG